MRSRTLLEINLFKVMKKSKNLICLIIKYIFFLFVRNCIFFFTIKSNKGVSVEGKMEKKYYYVNNIKYMNIKKVVKVIKIGGRQNRGRYNQRRQRE
jgi:hypothetical protein